MTRMRAAVLAVGLLAASALQAAAQIGAAGAASEYQLKAAYLVNFARFVEWPPTAAPGDELVICVVGDDPFGPALDLTLSNLRVGGRPVVASRLAPDAEMRRCRVAFVSASEGPRLDGLLERLRGQPILTVSDLPGFARRGGMIQFVTIGDRVRFEVDLGPVQEARLMVSSNLLRVATTVRPGARR